MAKQRKTNSGVDALGSLLGSIDTVAAIELKDNPEALAEIKAMTAGVKDSNITTAMELQDDAIDSMHDADDAAEAEEVAEAEQQESEIDNELETVLDDNENDND